MAYAQRYGGGFIDKPTLTTPIDSVFLNAVEAALLKLLTADGSADGQVLQWISGSTRFGPALLLNKNVDPAAAIDWTKINSTGAITNAAIAGAAAIARSKLDFGSGLVNADISAAAAIAASKLAAYPSDATKVLKGDGTWATVAPVVATTVAGLGAGTAGAQGLLRIGASPYDFIALTYDTTYAKWVSPVWNFSGQKQSNFTETKTDVSVMTEMDLLNFQTPIIQVKKYQDAGLTLQVNLHCEATWNTSTEYFQGQFGYHTLADGAVLGAVVFFGTIVTVNTAINALRPTHWGWQAPTGITAEQIALSMGFMRITGGTPKTASMSRPWWEVRWVA